MEQLRIITHIAESINRIVSTYCACFNQDFVSEKVHSHILYSMSDRVSVNDCVKLKLDEQFEHTLFELSAMFTL